MFFDNKLLHYDILDPNIFPQYYISWYSGNSLRVLGVRVSHRGKFQMLIVSKTMAEWFKAPDLSLT
jgi:hypothetical protein